jgi:hypothetical protein
MKTTKSPSELLDELQAKYGLVKYRATGNEHIAFCYLLVSEYDTKKEAWTSRWRVAGTSIAPPESLNEGTLEMVEIMREHHEGNGEAAHTPFLNAIALVTHGQGRMAYQAIDNPSTIVQVDGGVDGASEAEIQEALSIDPAMGELIAKGFVPTRVVNLISETGLVSEATIFYSDTEPLVERHEQDAREATPESSGVVDDALTQAMTFVRLTWECLSRGHAPTIQGLMDTAGEIGTDTVEGRSMLAFLLKMVSAGIANGDIGFGDSDSDSSEWGH